jgi:hypothetical protein
METTIKVKAWCPSRVTLVGIATALLVVAAGFWFVLWLGARSRNERLAVEKIERVGGTVSHSFTGPEWLQYGPGLLTRLIPIRPVSVSLSGDRITDAVLTDVAELDSVIEVSVGSSEITVEGLKRIAGMKNLRILWLGSPTTDGWLKQLSGLTNIRTLHVESKQVTDEGLKHVVSIPNLEALYIDSPQVTERGVGNLRAALPNCKTTRVKHYE